MRWPRRISRTSDTSALSGYWDDVVRVTSVTPVPPPGIPPDLTQIIRHLQMAEEADRSRPAYEDRLLQRLLAGQQENSAMTSTALSRPTLKQLPSARLDTRSPGRPLNGWQPGRLLLAAGLTVLVVAALLLSQLADRRWNRDDQPVVFAPTTAIVESSPDATVTRNDAATLVWEVGGGDDSLLYPSQAALAPDGNLWVADAGHNQFRIYSSEGELIDTWGTEGTGEGQFHFEREPHKADSSWADIAFAPDGSFYVTDPGNKRVQKFGPDRAFVLAWGEEGVLDGQFQDPLSVAVDGDGNVLVLDDYRNVIQKFTSDGEFLMKFGSHGRNPGQLSHSGNYSSGGLAIDATGAVWVADWGNHRVQQFAADGTFQYGFGASGGGWGLFRYPADIAIDPAGDLYVADWDNNRIQRFDPTGHFRGEWTAEDNGMPNPSGVVADGEGNVYVVVFGRARVMKYALAPAADVSTANHVVASIDAETPPEPAFVGADGASAEFEWQQTGGPDGFARPITAAIDLEGNLWVLDGPRDRFEIFGPDGSYLESWGETGSGPGQFDFTLDDDPNDTWGDILFAPDGSFFIADAGNHRIQKFDRDRNFLLEWGEDGDGDAQFTALGSLLLFPSGEIGVVDYRPLSISVYDQGGVFQRTMPFGFDQPRTVDGDGAIWGVHEGQIRLYGPDGDILSSIGNPDLPDMGYCFWADMALDADGNLFVVDRCDTQVEVFNSSGEPILIWNGQESPAGMFREPAAVVLDGAGNVYIVDGFNMTLSKFHITLP